MSPTRRKERVRQCRHTVVIAVVSAIASLAYAAASLYHLSSIRHPYHTSVLSGRAWVCELLVGNVHCIRENLGFGCQAFRRLVTALERKSGLCDSRGLTLRKVAERFQQSMSTVSQ